MSGIHGLDAFLEKIERSKSEEETKKLITEEIVKIKKRIKTQKLPLYDMKKAILKLLYIRKLKPDYELSLGNERDKEMITATIQRIISKLLEGEEDSTEIACLAIQELLKQDEKNCLISEIRNILELDNTNKSVHIFRLIKTSFSKNERAVSQLFEIVKRQAKYSQNVSIKEEACICLINLYAENTGLPKDDARDYITLLEKGEESLFNSYSLLIIFFLQKNVLGKEEMSSLVRIYISRFSKFTERMETKTFLNECNIISQVFKLFPKLEDPEPFVHTICELRPPLSGNSHDKGRYEAGLVSILSIIPRHISDTSVILPTIKYLFEEFESSSMTKKATVFGELANLIRNTPKAPEIYSFIIDRLDMMITYLFSKTKLIRISIKDILLHIAQEDNSETNIDETLAIKIKERINRKFGNREGEARDAIVEQKYKGKLVCFKESSEILSAICIRNIKTEQKWAFGISVYFICLFDGAYANDPLIPALIQQIEVSNSKNDLLSDFLDVDKDKMKRNGLFAGVLSFLVCRYTASRHSSFFIFSLLLSTLETQSEKKPKQSILYALFSLYGREASLSGPLSTILKSPAVKKIFPDNHFALLAAEDSDMIREELERIVLLPYSFFSQSTTSEAIERVNSLADLDILSNSAKRNDISLSSLMSTSGILYEDANIQIGFLLCSSRSGGMDFDLELYIGNKTKKDMTECHLRHVCGPSSKRLRIETQCGSIPSLISQNQQLKIFLHVNYLKAFSAIPLMSFSCREYSEKDFFLPVTMTRFCLKSAIPSGRSLKASFNKTIRTNNFLEKDRLVCFFDFFLHRRNKTEWEGILCTKESVRLGVVLSNDEIDLKCFSESQDTSSCFLKSIIAMITRLQ